ncbi:hypothetical protein [Leptospira noguchii]|uniref:hypothetical protein n=1 Tax=Leptospira noguchii TaxID=28182 RepID=UPI0012F7D1B6|nr:hypothetical protein [Leptospira noguchii]
MKFASDSPQFSYVELTLITIYYRTRSVKRPLKLSKYLSKERYSGSWTLSLKERSAKVPLRFNRFRIGVY